MATALQLINRVRRLHRFGDASDLSDNLSVGLLDRVNNALETVFEERTWQFQIRTDGYIRTNQTYTGTAGLAVTHNSAGFTIAPNPVDSADQNPFADDRVMEIVADSDTNFGGTAFTVDRGLSNAGFTGFFDENFPGTSGAPSFIVFVHKFLLPTTVRSVLSVKHQEQPVKLFFAEEFLDYDRVFPRPWDFRDDPHFVIVGGWAKSSRDTPTNSGANVEGVKMIVHPVPDTEKVINYSYIFREPTLVSATDSTSIIPESILSIVVDLAYARSLQGGIGNDPTTGFAMERRVLQDVVRKYAAQRADSYATNAVRSRDHVRPNRVEIGRLPRIVETL